VWQIANQFPHYFEFNEELLISAADAAYNGLFGTFLTNSEKERNAIEQVGTLPLCMLTVTENCVVLVLDQKE
jgi:hypothetical protein